MNLHQPATPPRTHMASGPGKGSSPPRVALALAGGGPLGAIYEIGALCALDEALQGINLNACTHYVGVSAGGFIAAGLANGMTPSTLRDLFIAPPTAGTESFDPAWLMRPAYAELAREVRRYADDALGVGVLEDVLERPQIGGRRAEPVVDTCLTCL